MIGDCRIDYTGRAKSVLGFGERIVLVKHDGTVIVHRGTMREPVNWQPPDTRISFEFDQDYFIISTRHYKPREKMKLFFRDIKMVLATSLRDEANIRITGMEKDFIERIIDDSSVIEDGLRIIKQEKKTRSGSIDLYGVDRFNTPVIIEVKRSPCGVSAVHQLIAYITDFRKKNKEASVRGILVAPRIQSIAKTILERNDLEYREIDYDFELPDEKQKSLTDY